MQHKFIWKKELFSESYKIFNIEKQIGTLINKTFSQTSHGEINGEKYSFKTIGLFNHYTQIIDIQNKIIIGEIKYSNWKNKATINVNGEKYEFKYDNIWNTKWSIYNCDGIQITFNSSTATGQIIAATDNPLLILIGLFISNYFILMSLVVVLIVLIPILTRH